MYDKENICEIENKAGILTELLSPEENCVEIAKWENNDWQVYEKPLSIQEGGAHKICFQSIDNVDNNEAPMCQIFFVDNVSPSISIRRPVLESPESELKLKSCVQSVVAKVDDKETGIKNVWTELWNSTSMVRNVSMELQEDGTYDASIDKQLPSGHYMLKVFAEDKAGNIGEKIIHETLIDSTFVESITPASCSINPETGGQCSFTFNICMRGGNSVQFSLDLLGDVVTPGMMNATITNGKNSTFVALLDDEVEAGVLTLDDEILNKRTSFKLNLNIPTGIVSQIGAGSHELKYKITSLK